jgi:hypothetical protein
VLKTHDAEAVLTEAPLPGIKVAVALYRLTTPLGKNAHEGLEGYLVYARGAAMRTTLYAAFRHEFIAVSGESRPDLPPDEATHDLFARVTAELHIHGFSLDDTIRTRLWGRDRAARDSGSGGTPAGPLW